MNGNRRKVPASLPRVDSDTAQIASIACALHFTRAGFHFRVVSSSPQWPLLGILPKLSKRAWTLRDTEALSSGCLFVPLQGTGVTFHRPRAAAARPSVASTQNVRTCPVSLRNTSCYFYFFASVTLYLRGIRLPLQ